MRSVDFGGHWTRTDLPTADECIHIVFDAFLHIFGSSKSFSISRLFFSSSSSRLSYARSGGGLAPNDVSVCTAFDDARGRNETRKIISTYLKTMPLPMPICISISVFFLALHFYSQHFFFFRSFRFVSFVAVFVHRSVNSKNCVRLCVVMTGPGLFQTKKPKQFDF